MGRKLNIYIVIILLASAFFPLEALSDAREEFHRTYIVEPDTEVEVTNIKGKVLISTWDEDYVDVHALKRTKQDQDELDLVTIEVNTEGFLEIKTVTRKYDPEEDSFFKRIFNRMRLSSPRVTVDYTIKLPGHVLLRKAKTVNGDVELQGTDGDTVVYTTKGSVIVDKVRGCIEAKTTNGTISITGGVRIKNAKTTNGNIKASLSMEGIDDTSIKTVNGSVDLYLSPNMNADLELKTTNGKISARNFPLMLDTVSSKHIIGTLGSGGKTISVKTVNGNISLNKE